MTTAMATVHPTSPTLELGPWHNVRVEAYGRPHDWRIGDWDQGESFTKVARLARRYGLEGILCPRANTFTGELCRFRELDRVITLEGVMIRRGKEAEGAVIPRGWGLFLATADCHTVVAYGAQTKTLIAAHAGRDSLFNRPFASGHENPHREPTPLKGIVHRIVERLEDDRKHIHVSSGLGIGGKSYPHRFDDPAYGRANRLIDQYLRIKYGPAADMDGDYLDLGRLIRAQCQWNGIPDGNISTDSVDTYADKGADGQPRWHSARRGDESRNGILIAHVA